MRGNVSVQRVRAASEHWLDNANRPRKEVFRTAPSHDKPALTIQCRQQRLFIQRKSSLHPRLACGSQSVPQRNALRYPYGF